MSCMPDLVCQMEHVPENCPDLVCQIEHDPENFQHCNGSNSDKGLGIDMLKIDENQAPGIIEIENDKLTVTEAGKLNIHEIEKVEDTGNDMLDVQEAKSSDKDIVTVETLLCELKDTIKALSIVCQMLERQRAHLEYHMCVLAIEVIQRRYDHLVEKYSWNRVKTHNETQRITYPTSFLICWLKYLVCLYELHKESLPLDLCDYTCYYKFPHTKRLAERNFDRDIYITGAPYSAGPGAGAPRGRINVRTDCEMYELKYLSSTVKCLTSCFHGFDLPVARLAYKVYELLNVRCKSFACYNLIDTSAIAFLRETLSRGLSEYTSEMFNHSVLGDTDCDYEHVHGSNDSIS